MRALEIVAGLIVALVAFVVLKIIGLMLKIALIGALVGFGLGLLVTMLFRRRTT